MEAFVVGIEAEVISDPSNTPTTAFVIVESDKGYMLLYNKHHCRWELTGGYMEQGESPKDCAVRECKEESNQNLLELKFLGIAKYKAMNAAIYYSFLHEEEAFCENAEIDRMLWWKPNEEIDGKVDAESLKLIALYASSIQT